MSGIEVLATSAGAAPLGFIGAIAELHARQVQVGKLAVALVQGQPGVERVVDSGEGGMPAGGSEGGVRWLMMLARPRRFAWVASPTSSTMSG